MSSHLARRHWLGLLALLASACVAGGPSEPEPVQVPVRLIAPEAAGITGPIRLALVWRYGTGSNQHWLSTFDEELATVPESTTAWFDLPSRSQRSALTDVTPAYVTCDDEDYPVRLAAAIPRLVAYEDTDNSGDFDPDLPLNPGRDRVLAVSPTANASSYIAGFTDLDAVLAKLPMESAECIRTYTGGRYSAFFAANDYSTYAWATATPLSTTLELSPTPYAAVAMACSEMDVYSMAGGTPMINEQRSTLIDPGLVEDLCTDAPWSCARGAFSKGGMSGLTGLAYPGFSKFTFCTAVGNLDVMWSVTETIDCDECECNWLHSHQTWVADATRPPAGWPCGEQVEYCWPRALSVWALPEYCISLSNERPE